MLPTICKNFRLITQKLGSGRVFFILQKFFLLLIFLRTFLVCFGSFRNKSVCFSCLYIHFWFVSFHFETNLFVSVVSMHIFGLFWFILKQNCLFRLFRNSLKHRNNSKQDYHWFRKWTETNAKQILFRLFSVRTEIFIYLFRGHPLCKYQLAIYQFEESMCPPLSSSPRLPFETIFDPVVLAEHFSERSLNITFYKEFIASKLFCF